MLAEAAKTMGMPYVKFDVLFAEGAVMYGGEMTGTPQAHLAMQPVWATLGDYCNLLGVRTIIHTGSQATTALHSYPLLTGTDREPLCAERLAEVAAVLATPGSVVTFTDGESDGSASKRIPLQRRNDVAVTWTALGAAPVEVEAEGGQTLCAFTMGDVLELIMPHESRGRLPSHMVVLPGGADGASDGGFFHVDSAGNTCFSAAEAAKASQLIVDSGFLEELQARIKETAFDLPQHKHEAEGYLCNEVVYGNMSVLRLTGLVRLDN